MGRTQISMIFAVLLFAVAVHGSKYVQYKAGNMPLVITVPHGGDKNPSSFPERSIDKNVSTTQKYCGFKGDDGECVYDHMYDSPEGCHSGHCKVSHHPDKYASEIASELAAKIEELTGKRPYLVKLEIAKNKVAGNRARDEATFGDSKAVEVYDEYMGRIEELIVVRELQAMKAIEDTEQEGLLLDIHGTSHKHGMVELGYAVTGDDLDCGFDCFNVTGMSIRELIHEKCTPDDRACAEAFLRGPKSLGHFIYEQGYPVMPSPERPKPDGESYHHGGYSVQTYGERDGEPFDAIQIEIPKHLRYYDITREPFVEGLAAAAANFMEMHYGLVIPEKPQTTTPSCEAGSGAPASFMAGQSFFTLWCMVSLYWCVRYFQG